jgi:hypothetical protein
MQFFGDPKSTKQGSASMAKQQNNLPVILMSSGAARNRSVRMLPVLVQLSPQQLGPRITQPDNACNHNVPVNICELL